MSHILSLQREPGHHLHIATAGLGVSCLDILKDLKQAITLNSLSGHMPASDVTKPISGSWQPIGSLELVSDLGL